LQKDRLLQRTNVGIHKDDLIFLLNDNIFKSIASQGQRKSLLFACKLAEFEILKKVKGAAPILLLDDVFEKLDENRMRNLLEYVCQRNKGQVFITDTHYERLQNSLSQFGNAVQIIELE
jgi:DNA replication and repair protein RecF